MIERYEAAFNGKTRVTKVDIYKSAGIANRLGINSAPSIVIVKDGKIDRVLTENICEEELASSIE